MTDRYRTAQQRARVNATTFIGDFTESSDPKLDAGALMNDHFDLFLHFDGNRPFTLMFRLPAVHAGAVKPYLIGDDLHGVTSQVIGDDLVVRPARFEVDAELTYWKEMPNCGSMPRSAARARRDRAGCLSPS